MKRVVLTFAVTVFLMVALSAQTKRETVTMYGKTEDKPLNFKINIEKLKEKGFRNTKKGTVYLNEDGTITLRKLKFRTAGLMEQIPTTYYEMQTFTGKID